MDKSAGVRPRELKHELTRPFRGAGVGHASGMVPDPGPDADNAENECLNRAGGWTDVGAGGPGGDGDITAVTVTAPLNGGGTSGAVAIGMDADGAAGTFSNPTLTIDSFGRVIEAADGLAALTDPLLLMLCGG